MVNTNIANTNQGDNTCCIVGMHSAAKTITKRIFPRYFMAWLMEIEPLPNLERHYLRHILLFRVFFVYMIRAIATALFIIVSCLAALI